jgi:hypothetical protein
MISFDLQSQYKNKVEKESKVVILQPYEESHTFTQFLTRRIKNHTNYLKSFIIFIQRRFLFKKEFLS